VPPWPARISADDLVQLRQWIALSAGKSDAFDRRCESLGIECVARCCRPHGTGARV